MTPELRYQCFPPFRSLVNDLVTAYEDNLYTADDIQEATKLAVEMYHARLLLLGVKLEAAEEDNPSA